MQTVNIDLLKSEAQRLLQLNIERLEQMMEVDGVITNAPADGENSEQTFTRESTPKYISDLENELTKLKDMELVIAVVGTMKAGKSTTINAIVGTEVLPNRNRPMTALPTLIRHTPRQVEPALKFKNNKPINDLLQKISRLASSEKAANMLENLKKNSEMKELLQSIVKKQSFDQVYKGVDEIYECLKTLNDLVRLSSELGKESDIEFPFSSYTNVNEIPVIEVEFAHLRKSKAVQGQLTLLDTPGPNEAGQDHLKIMLEEQLKKASAVLAVFDYTQLKSDADAGVRAEIKSIAEQHKGRLYALVNKFDQKDRHGDDKATIKNLVANELMDKCLNEESVFPVSSSWAYLANRAKREIAVNGNLPSPDLQPWIIDFAKEALGRRWETKITEADTVLEAANDLWDDSGFHKPMEKVIRAAHSQAALLSLESAAGKLSKCSSDLENFFDIRNKSLSKSSDELKELINSLKTEIEEVESIESNTQEKIELILTELEESSANAKSNSNNDIKKEIERYFKEGKLKSERLAIEKKEEEKRRRSKNIRDFIPIQRIEQYEKPPEKNKADFNPDEEEVPFDEKNDAKNFIETIKNSIESILKKRYEYLVRHHDGILSKLKKSLDDEILKSEEVITKFNTNMQDSGFKVKFTSPKINTLGKELHTVISLSEKLIKNEQKLEKKRVNQTGFWGGFKRFIDVLDNDWGVDYEYNYNNVSIVKIKNIKEDTTRNINKIFDDFSQKIENEVINPIQTDLNEFFLELRQAIEKIRGNLQQSIRDKQKSQDEQEIFKKNLLHLSNDVPEFKEDTELLGHDISSAKSDKTEVMA